MTSRARWLVRFVLELKLRLPAFPSDQALAIAEEEWTRRDWLEPEEVARFYVASHGDKPSGGKEPEERGSS